MTIDELAQHQQRQSAADAIARDMLALFTTGQMLALTELWARAGKLAQDSGRPELVALYVCATTQMMHEVLRRYEDELT